MRRLGEQSSGGMNSLAGSRFVERTLGIVAKRRRRNRNVLELLTACRAAMAPTPPSLLSAEAELAAV